MLPEARARLLRNAAHCREGFRLARELAPFREQAAATARASSLRGAAFWQRVEPEADPADPAAALLVAWLAGDPPVDALEAGWNALSLELSLSSVLSSHPYAGVEAWSLRRMSPAWSRMQRGS